MKITEDSVLTFLACSFSVGGFAAALLKDWGLAACFMTAASMVNQQRLWNERERAKAAVAEALEGAAKTFEAEPHDSLCDMARRSLCPHEAAEQIRAFGNPAKEQ